MGYLLLGHPVYRTTVKLRNSCSSTVYSVIPVQSSSAALFIVLQDGAYTPFCSMYVS